MMNSFMNLLVRLASPNGELAAAIGPSVLALSFAQFCDQHQLEVVSELAALMEACGFAQIKNGATRHAFMKIITCYSNSSDCPAFV